MKRITAIEIVSVPDGRYLLQANGPWVVEQFVYGEKLRIATTAYPQKGEITAALAAEFLRHYVAKPIETDEAESGD